MTRVRTLIGIICVLRSGRVAVATPSTPLTIVDISVTEIAIVAYITVIGSLLTRTRCGVPTLATSTPSQIVTSNTTIVGDVTDITFI